MATKPMLAYFRVRGIITISPKRISNTPLNSTQNLGDPMASGTIGSNHSGFLKWLIPIMTNGIPYSVARKFLRRVLLSIDLAYPESAEGFGVIWKYADWSA
jgi:hypothetical protein